MQAEFSIRKSERSQRPDKTVSYKSWERTWLCVNNVGSSTEREEGFLTSSLIQFPVFVKGLGILHPPERPSCFFWDAPILPVPAWSWPLGPRVSGVMFQPSNLSHLSHWNHHINNLHEPLPRYESRAGCSLGVKQIINGGLFSLVHQIFPFCLRFFFFSQ